MSRGQLIGRDGGPASLALDGRLPDRYERDDWDRPFRALLSEHLTPGCTILDAGAGRSPAVPAGERPDSCFYAGLDLSASELAAAPAGSYDETVVADVTERVPELEERFDLVISWLMLEHVAPIDRALDNLRAYLKPGGRLVVELAGGRTLFAAANRMLPHRLVVPLLGWAQGRDPETVFPAHYDRCHARALRGELSRDWDEWQVRALHTGAHYFGFSRYVRAAYLAYENWAYRRGLDGMAPFYLVTGRRPVHAREAVA